MAYNLSKILQMPNNPEDIPKYLQEAIPALVEAINLVAEIQLDSHVEPAKPREGMLRYADGSDWNPGGTGVGLYRYTAGGWVLIG